MNNQKNNNPFNKRKGYLIGAACVAVIVLAISFKFPNKSADTSETTGTDKVNKIEMVKDSDVVISLNDVTEKASFYPAQINGTDLEIIAVKAPDGTIRTAFNTCQVCYSSGKGYYQQEGDALVCQNCGNRFGMGDVEVTKGGCNPVPITDEYKTVDNEIITVSKDFLEQAVVLFQNWK